MIWLVRHPPVALHWQKRCYGQSDVGLSRQGAGAAQDLVSQLVQLSPDIIIHSDMRRTRAIAERAADRLSIEARADRRWQERDFGSWEGRSWQAIYRETGNAMDGMLDAPETFRPGGGETTVELATRSLAAWRDLPASRKTAVIAHGGPIAIILAKQDDAEWRALADHIPPTGSINAIAAEKRP